PGPPSVALPSPETGVCSEWSVAAAVAIAVTARTAIAAVVSLLYVMIDYATTAFVMRSTRRAHYRYVFRLSTNCPLAALRNLRAEFAVEIQSHAERFALARNGVGHDQIAPVAVPVQFLILTRHEPPRFVLVEFDDVFHGVAAEPLDGVGGRLPVFLTRSEERHPERLDLDRRTHFAEKRPDLPRSFLPKRDLGEHLLRNPIALAPEFDDFFAGGSSRNGALAGGSGQAVEARSVVFRATVHAPTASFAQKNPPVSLRWG